MGKKREVRVYTTRYRNHEGRILSESIYTETRVYDSSGKVLKRKLERKIRG